MYKIGKVLSIILLSVGLFSTGLAKEGLVKANATKSSHMGSPMGMYKRLDLTEAQLSQIKAIFKEVKQQSRHKEMKPLQNKLNKLSKSEDYDSDAVSQLAEKITAIKKAQIEVLTHAKNKAWNILTPSQKQKALKLEKRRNQKLRTKLKQKKEKKQKSLKSDSAQ